MKFQQHQPGTVFFERFELESWLWVGNPSSVFSCRDLKHGNKRVALKILDRSLVRDPNILNRFLREMDLMNIFSHPNIIEVHEVFFNEEQIGYTMPYFENGTLADELSAGKALEIRRTMMLLSQILRALRAIHEEGILHRDLKPENILIDDEGFIQIADFGIACEVGDRERFQNTGISGTISYVSPEYIEKGQCDERSDLYAVGAILYELLTGTLPYHGKSLLETIRMKVRQDPVSPHLLRPECPIELSEITMKAMARDPEQRYASVDEMIADLEAQILPFQLAMFSNIAWRAAA